jgi:hypothetical protein
MTNRRSAVLARLVGKVAPPPARIISALEREGGDRRGKTWN